MDIGLYEESQKATARLVGHLAYMEVCQRNAMHHPDRATRQVMALEAMWCDEEKVRLEREAVDAWNAYSQSLMSMQVQILP